MQIHPGLGKFCGTFLTVVVQLELRTFSVFYVATKNMWLGQYVTLLNINIKAQSLSKDENLIERGFRSASWL